MTEDRRNPPEAPPPVQRNADGTIIPGTQPPHMPQVLRGSAFAAMPETPFTPDPAIAGGQMPVQPGDHPKQAVDPNQPVYANPQASGTWAANRPPGEKERLEREMNEGEEEDPRMMGADNAPHPNVVATSDVHDAPVSEGEHAQETEEARRLREEQERLQRERSDAERQEEERRQQEMQHQNPPQG